MVPIKPLPERFIRPVWEVGTLHAVHVRHDILRYPALIVDVRLIFRSQRKVVRGVHNYLASYKSR